MTDNTGDKTINAPKRTLGLKRGLTERDTVRQSFSHGRTNTVQVERKKRRITLPGEKAEAAAPAPVARPVEAPAAPARPAPVAEAPMSPAAAARAGLVLRQLSTDEIDARARALADAKVHEAEERRAAVDAAARRAAENERLARERGEAERRKAEEDARHQSEDSVKQRAEEAARRRFGEEAAKTAAEVAARPPGALRTLKETEEPEDDRPGGGLRGRIKAKAPADPKPVKRIDDRRRGKLTLVNALDDTERARSLASIRRRRERERAKIHDGPRDKVMREVVIPERITIADLANRMSERAVDVIKHLMKQGQMVQATDVIEADTAQIIAEDMGHTVRRVAESDVEAGLFLKANTDVDSELVSRSPVVTVMGHVDHGKTSLLDAIRTTKVAEREFGGITQHIGAYQVDTSHGRVTFLDTPGHEAFTAMRARGAQATDMVVLVVAADDGVMPQTVEAINHAKAANVPILVAVNKIDKPGADPDRVKRELANHGLVPEDWGGQTIFIHTSAKRGDGIPQLLEMTALQAEILELRANPARAGRGVIVEGRLDRGRGPVATALIQSGTLKEGDAVVVGSHSGRVRAMFNDRGKKVQSAGPSDPVEILGLSGVPQAGDTMLVVADERKARQIATVRSERDRLKGKSAARITLEDLHKQIAAGEVKELRLVIKADVQGSVEALTESLERLSTDEVKLKVIHSSVGTVTESDVMLASASNAIVLGFNVKADPKATSQAQANGVDMRSYNVIYDAINDVKAALSGMLAPEIREVVLGRAQVRQLFPISKVGTIYGSSVSEGKIVRGSRVRIKRGDTVLGESTVSSLKRFKDDVREVLQGLECGIGIEGIKGVQPNDVIEAYTTEEVARTL